MDCTSKLIIECEVARSSLFEIIIARDLCALCYCSKYLNSPLEFSYFQSIGSLEVSLVIVEVVLQEVEINHVYYLEVQFYGCSTWVLRSWRSELSNQVRSSAFHLIGRILKTHLGTWIQCNGFSFTFPFFPVFSNNKIIIPIAIAIVIVAITVLKCCWNLDNVLSRSFALVLSCLLAGDCFCAGPWLTTIAKCESQD